MAFIDDDKSEPVARDALQTFGVQRGDARDNDIVPVHLMPRALDDADRRRGPYLGNGLDRLECQFVTMNHHNRRPVQLTCERQESEGFPAAGWEAPETGTPAAGNGVMRSPYCGRLVGPEL